MKKVIERLQKSVSEGNDEDVEFCEEILAENLKKASRIGNFYSLPFSYICSVVKKSKIKIVKTIIDVILGLYESGHKNIPLLLEYLDLPELKLDECIKIISSFKSSPICVHTGIIYEEFSIHPEIDWEFTVSEKEKEISKLKGEMTNLNRKIKDMQDETVKIRSNNGEKQNEISNLSNKETEHGDTKSEIIDRNHKYFTPSSPMRERQTLKLLILGDARVGKTSLISQFVDREFTAQYRATIGNDFSKKQINVGDHYIALQIWDTAGQEMFQTPNTSIYRGTDCCILVYDVTKPSSFESIKKWKEEFDLELGLTNSSDFPYLLLGNKSDLPDHLVQVQTAREFGQMNGGMQVFEVSAKTADFVQSAFESIVKKALENPPKENFQLPPRIIKAGTSLMLKVLLIGDAGVGKTSIVGQFVYGKFPTEYKATIGSVLYTKLIEIEGCNIDLQIWDMAGREVFRSLVPRYYGGADCCILVYDVTKPDTFENIKKWKEGFDLHLGLTNSSGFPYLLLGNKSDLPNHLVQVQDAREFGQMNGEMQVFEVSAKTADIMQSAFESIVKVALEKKQV